MESICANIIQNPFRLHLKSSFHMLLVICSLLPLSVIGAPAIRYRNSGNSINQKHPASAHLIGLLKGSETDPDNIHAPASKNKEITATSLVSQAGSEPQAPLALEPGIAKYLEEEETSEEDQEDQEDYGFPEDEEEGDDEYAESDLDDDTETMYQSDEAEEEEEEYSDDAPDPDLDEDEDELTFPYEVNHGPVSYIDDIPVSENDDSGRIELGLRKVKFEASEIGNGIESVATSTSSTEISESDKSNDESEDSDWEDPVNSDYDDVDLDYEYDDNYEED